MDNINDFDFTEFNNIVKDNEKLILLRKKETVEQDIISFISSLICSKYNCNVEESLKYWEIFKGESRWNIL